MEVVLSTRVSAVLFQHLGNIKSAKPSYFTLKVIREHFGLACHCSWNLMARILRSVRCKDNISIILLLKYLFS